MRRNALVPRLLLSAVTAATAIVGFATVASAHIGTATIQCTSSTTVNVGFTYEGGTFTVGDVLTETVTLDGVVVYTRSIPITSTEPFGDGTTFSVSAGVAHTVVANAVSNLEGEVIGFPVSQTLTCGTSVPPCPPGTGLNFRWHYSANPSGGSSFTSGSWSGTKSQVCSSSFSMGPQAMEGDLKLPPGATLRAGYDFTVPGNNQTFTVTVSNAKVVFAVTCVSGATPSQSTLTVPMQNQAYTVTNANWYPSGDQHDPSVYQGSITVPDLCGGGQIRLQQGGTFSATIS